MRLVFLHSAGASGDLWAAQRLAFAAAHEVRTPDLPGHGASREEPLARIEDMAAWVARTVDGLADTVAVGHSMGGAVAMALASDHPLRGLVLAGAAPRLHVPAGFAEEVGRDPHVAVERLASGGFSRGTRTSVVERASLFLARNDPTVLARDFAASAGFDATPLLGRIRVPTLIVVGADDRLTPLGDARTLARGIRRADLVVIEGAGHMAMLERAREFNQALASFLERV